MAKPKFLLTLAVVLYPFLAGAPALAQASFSSQVVTTQPPPSTGCVQPTAATSFLTIDNTVYLYFTATITTSDSLTSNWLAPDGTVVPGVAWAVNTGNLCFPGASLSIANLPVSQFGSWQARVYDGGKLLFSVPFTVTGYSSQVVTTQAPPSGSCAQPTAAASFLTSDNTVYLYFEATIAAGDSLSGNWLAPDGTVVAGPTWDPNTGHFCFPGASLSISSLPAGQLGSWQARVYDNGRLFFSVPFTVTAPQATGTAITVTNDASFAPQISPGSLVALFGNGNVLATNTISGTNPPLPTSANGTSVTINGILCPLIFVSPSQINLQAPMELQPGTATVVVSNNGQSFSATAPVLTAAPGIFSTDFYANGGVAILQDGATFTTLNAGNPAVPGENVTMYFTGIGPVTNNPGTGAAASGGSSLSYATSAVSLTVNGVSVQPSFTGLVAGIVSTGQVNFQIPANTPSGNSIPVVLTVGGVSSKTVHISVTGGATVAPGTYSLTTSTSGAGSGTVGYSPAGTSCGSGCLTFAAGTVVTLTAAPNTGSTFAGWSGACSGTGDCTVTMASNQTVTAAFNLTGNSNPTSTIIYQTGFEPPTFSPGTINGQDSWSAFVAPITPEIETTTVKTGVQAVAITPVPSTTGVLGAGRSASYNAANQVLTFNIDANLSATGTPSFWTVLNTSYNSPSPNIGINIDQSGQIHIFIMGTDNSTGVFIARGVWNHYELDVNFINDTVSAFYNGAPVLQGAAFSPAGTTLGGYQFDSQGGIPLVGTDTGYFDNLSVTASAAAAPALVSIAVTPTAPTISLSATLQLTATGTYSNGSTQNLTSSVIWTSSNTAIAAVNASGLVTGVSAGSATITATSGSVTGTVSLTVGGSASGPFLTITTSGTGSGTVSSSPAGTSCGTGCLSFAAGTVVTVTATPNTGSTFTGWSGACSKTGSCTVTMNSNQAVSATFNLTATAPAVTLSSTSLNFGRVPVATPSYPDNVTVANFGSAPVSILGISLAGTNPNDFSTTVSDFSAGGSCSGSSVPAATICAITVSFNPLATGSRTATLKVSDGTGGVQTVSLTGLAISPGSQPPIAITSLSASQVQPFDSLTISGSGFDPTNGAISVVLTPEGIGTPMTIPIFSATATSLQFIVPPFFDQTSGSFSSGIVDLQAVQLSGSMVATSNTITGLAISAPPQVPSGLAPGTVTLALLSGALSVSQTVNAAAASAANLNGLSSSLSTLETDLEALAPAVGAVTGAPSQVASIATVNGGSFAITSRVLAIADQLLLAYSTQFVTQVQTRPGSAAAPCPARTGNAATDAVICQMQQSAQQAVLGSTTATPAGAGILLSGALLPLAGWAAEGNSSEGGNAGLAAGAYQLALDIIAPMVAAYGASDPPAFSQSLAITGPTLLASLGGGSAGLAVLPVSIDAVNTYPFAAALAGGAADPGPQGGLVIGSPPLAALIAGGNPQPVLHLPTLPPGSTAMPTSATASSPACKGGLDIEADGAGTVSGGAVIACENGLGICQWDYPAGTPVALLAYPNNVTKTMFFGWQDACIGQGNFCKVTIECNTIITVKAEFTELADGGGTLTVTPNPPATLTAVQGGPNPSLSLTATTTPAGAPALTFNAYVSPSPSVLSISCGGSPCVGIGTTASVTVTANIAGLPPNTYGGAIVFSSPSGEFAAFAVPVTLVITPQSPPPATFGVTVIKAGTGSGTVSANPQGFSYPAGTPVTLTETPDSQSSFAGWGSASGVCSGTGKMCAFKVEADDIISATFNLNPTLTVTTAGTGSGTVSRTSSPSAPGVPCGTNCWSYPPGTAVTLTASPAAGSTFTNWSGGGCSGSGACVVTVNSNLSVTAIFSLLPPPAQQYTLTTGTSGTGNGSVAQPAPPGTPCGAGCWSYPPGTAVTLTATPAPGSTFAGWSGCAGSGMTCTMTTNSNVSVTAIFSPASGYTYTDRGGDQEIQTQSFIPPSGCSPSPDVSQSVGSPPATLSVSTPVESAGSFSGTLTLGTYTTTETFPASSCTIAGSTVSDPGSTQTAVIPAQAMNFSGTSDGHLISVSQATQHLWCATWTTCSVSGTVSVLAGNVMVTLNINQSSPALGITQTWSLILWEQLQ